MMDTDKWKNFAGTKYANAKAIGGPTIELLVKSYNAVDENTKKLEEYDSITSENANSNGYKIKTGSGNWADSSDYGSEYIIPFEGASPCYEMWFYDEDDSAREKPYSYYIASPCGFSQRYLFGANILWETLRNINDESFSGFRPIVFIPKSDLK